MEGRTIGGKYSLERELAKGGMGAIWVALDAQLRRRVALKLMSPDHLASPTARSRFEREAMAVAQLSSPHVVQIYDYGVDDGAPYIVMELLEGEDLQTRLARLGKLPIGTVTSIVAQAAKALGAAHGSGIVHRDIKPANIFLARHDTDEIVKILDFGVAALVAAPPSGDMHVTRAGGVVGTPHYMSPEQVRGSRGVDFRSDLWSLAVVAYRALTGKLPFESDAFGELLIEICTDPVPPPSRAVPELGPEVDRFFERALARDPARRFESARDMASALAALAASGKSEKATKILVVDDEPDVALLMKQRFRQQIRKGVYEFVFAGDGEAALEQLRVHPDVEIALTDINMPGMDGLTFLRRAGELNPLVKVVVVSAYSDMSNIREAMNRGAFDFLVKPIDFKDLEVTIDKTIKHARELRRTARSTEENSILRMFVNTGIVERLLPIIRTSDVSANEWIEATVAFIDVHGFTPLTSSEPPDSALRTLNANFEIIVPEVTSRRGVVDKFVGDAVMAVFRGDEPAPADPARPAGDPPPQASSQGRPRPRPPAEPSPADPARPTGGPLPQAGSQAPAAEPDHLERALDACLAARSQLKSLAMRTTGERSPYAHGVAVGIGSGGMIIGSIGSKVVSRLDYTVLGGVVNTAAQLEAVADKDQILIVEDVYQRVQGSFECELVGQRTLHANTEPVSVYNVIRKIELETPISSAETLLMDGDSQDEQRISHTNEIGERRRPSSAG
jgi:class 3 adenylate cyclase/tRNA A-37 threonylcarbamoyl transferase component Bud32